jgi:hypothetical protein
MPAVAEALWAVVAVLLQPVVVPEAVEAPFWQAEEVQVAEAQRARWERQRRKALRRAEAVVPSRQAHQQRRVQHPLHREQHRPHKAHCRWRQQQQPSGGAARDWTPCHRR